MNIFVLHENPEVASQYHVDRHVVKMPLETAQMLCTAIWQTGNEAPYKPTHKNHPCNLWLMQSLENFNWLTELGVQLCKEYTHRYGKTHKSEAVIRWCIDNKPNLPEKPMTLPALAMPEEFKVDGDTVGSYRRYYCGSKSHLHKWTKRDIPQFIKQ